ncbi:MAG: GMP synthase [glutamine-hydrolyzing] [Gammaproteobacteria bacterium]|nr:GMP synthase [glutamine-hydrolyzing] [Gammaproteobacteria bacterium]
MRIGILKAGQVPDELSEKHGDYPEMFKRLLRSAAPELEFNVYPATKEQLPKQVDECDAWLVTGSRHGVYDPLPWIDPLKGFLKRAYDENVPIVGICFGHHILAEALGGRAQKSEKGWGLGVHRYEVFRKPAWMSGIGNELFLYALHQDQVTELPEQAEVLAGSDFCPYSVLAYRGNAISIQPHPEFSTEFEGDLIEYRRSTSFPESDADTALGTLESPIHTKQVAHWIVRFIKGSLGLDMERKAS